MNGMQQFQLTAFSTSSDLALTSFHVELPQKSTLAQIALSCCEEAGDQATASAVFDQVQFIDEHGVLRFETFSADSKLAVSAFGKNGVVRVDFFLFAGNCTAICIVNFFFWARVF